MSEEEAFYRFHFKRSVHWEGEKRRAKGDFRTSLPALPPPLSDAAPSREAMPRRDGTEDGLKRH